jgi:circadian clock protein KaiC
LFKIARVDVENPRRLSVKIAAFSCDRLSMNARAQASAAAPPGRDAERSPDRNLPKSPTGIAGLDEITFGGLPRGRPTLVCGAAGCGKTLLAMEFLVRGVTQFDEPGVYVTFEESEEELAQNVRSLGFDVEALVQQGRLAFDYVHIDRREIEETGEYDLEGLFVRLALAIDSVGAKRVVLDTIESLFSGFSNMALLRSELRRLFRWLKDRNLTVVITGERGDGTLTRQGLEEYVSDCVILLDHRVDAQISTRRLRVVKYRGTVHGTNEYPFLIDAQGISVLPITSLGLDHRVSNERVSTGIGRLDNMLGGGGLYRGSSILVSGTAGSGKTTISAHFADATCRRGERCLYLAFEESPDQIIRNMRSVGIDLQAHVDAGRLRLEAARPSLHGVEMHLAQIHRLVSEFRPSAIVIDPISNLGNTVDASAMLLRLIDFLKTHGITAMFVNLTASGGALEATEVGVSSLIDTWLVLRDIEAGGERNRGLYVIKSRGMHHSNQIREFVITSRGIDLLEVYAGPEGVLTGSLRASQEAREKAAAVAREQEQQRRQRELATRRAVLQAQIDALQQEASTLDEEIGVQTRQYTLATDTIEQDRRAAVQRRSKESE